MRVERGARQTRASVQAHSPEPGRPPFRTRTSAFFVFFLLPLPLFLFFNFIFGGSFNKMLILSTEQHIADESKDVPWAP